jgi:hypothetical protein
MVTILVAVSGSVYSKTMLYSAINQIRGWRQLDNDWVNFACGVFEVGLVLAYVFLSYYLLGNACKAIQRITLLNETSQS